MRRILASLLVLSSCLPVAAGAAEPPHAWLFGAWTGGLFPAASPLTAAACLAQPAVIFTRDVVMRATLTDASYIERIVATARTAPGRTDFTFAPLAQPASDPANALSPLSGTAAGGFGCDNPDVLHVRRISDTEISFPGCSDFPNPLVRCPSK